MKSKFIIAVISCAMFACTSKNQSSISQDEKENIVKEIEFVVNSISEGMLNLDVNKMIKEPFLNSKNFTYIGIDGRLMNFNELYNTAKGTFESFSKAEYNVNKKKINVVSKDVAIVSINYSGAFYSPELKLTFPNVGKTFVLNKIENEWKVIHFHESVQETKFIQEAF